MWVPPSNTCLLATRPRVTNLTSMPEIMPQIYKFGSQNSSCNFFCCNVVHKNGNIDNTSIVISKVTCEKQTKYFLNGAKVTCKQITTHNYNQYKACKLSIAFFFVISLQPDGIYACFAPIFSAIS